MNRKRHSSEQIVGHPRDAEARVLWRGKGAKRCLKAGLFLSALPAILLSSSSCKNEPAVKNILLVTVDTLRADRLGCYGD